MSFKLQQTLLAIKSPLVSQNSPLPAFSAPLARGCVAPGEAGPGRGSVSRDRAPSVPQLPCTQGLPEVGPVAGTPAGLLCLTRLRVFSLGDGGHVKYLLAPSPP